jgi:transmembrane sensor
VTKPDDSQPEMEPLVREAIGLVVRLTSGEATTADATEIKRWRAQSPAHEAAFRQAARLWKEMGAAVVSTQKPHSTVSDRLIARRALIGGAIAAAVAGYVVARPPMQMWPSYEEMLADYRTAKGEQRKVDLSPGVSAELSTLTSLAVRQSSEMSPSIELIAGEAAFMAKTRPNAPLTLVAADGQVTASEASFNARCLDGVVSVTCLTGSVEVESHDRTVRLGAGEQVSYSAAGLTAVASVDVDKATSWRAGMLVFQNAPLNEVVDEVNRYRPGRIVITNEELGRRVVNATFRRDQLNTFIAQIQQLFGAKVTNLPAGLLLLS